MHKPQLIAHLKALVGEKVLALQAEIAATVQARNADTKSSAGDKHEVGRAMVQQELDQLEAQVDKLEAQWHELMQLPEVGTTQRVTLGSLVTTEHDRYLIAIGIGYVELGGERCAVISPASPIGQALLGKRIGEGGSLNGRTFSVQAID